MKCMYAQTRPRFILSSEGVFGGMEFEPMLTPREKSPLPKMSPEEDRTRDAVDSEPKHYQLSYPGPCSKFISRVPDQNGVSLLYIMLEIHHSGREPSICLFVCDVTSQQHASLSQGRFCSEKFTCCHTETEVADQTFYLFQSQYALPGPTSPNSDPITPRA